MSRKEIIRSLKKSLKAFNTKDYKSFLKEKFPFKIPKDYLQWDEISQILDVELRLLECGESKGLNVDKYQQALIWASYSSPKIYCIKPDLLENFQISDVGDKPELFLDLNFPVQSLILLLPPKTVKSPAKDSAYSAYIDYIIINILGDNHPIPPAYFALCKSAPKNSNYKVKIVWSSMDTNGDSFIGSRGIRENGNFQKSEFLGASSEQHEITLKMREIVLQALMSLEFKPELIEDIKEGEIKAARGFKKSESNIIYPRWIGKYYEKSIKSSKKSPHWRRGHWRRQPFGSREKPRYQWIWIEPSHIN